jgi:radical SAM protein
VSAPRSPGLGAWDIDRAPFLFIWEMTRACALACVHCRAAAVRRRDPRELTTAEAKRMLDTVRRFGTPLVVFTGGDPVRRPDLVELVRYGSELGLRVTLTPSGTPRTSREKLAELQAAGLARLAVSLDGAGPAVHDAFRQVRGSFGWSLDILRHARDLGLPRQVNTTVTRQTAGELPAFVPLLTELEVVLWAVFFVVPTGRAVPEQSLTADEVERVLEWLAGVAERAPFDVKTTAAPHFRRVLLQRRARCKSAGPPPAQAGFRVADDGIGRSAAGITDGCGMLFVSHTGEIMPSGFLPLPVGNVREDDLVSVYREHPLFVALRDPDRLEGKCGYCEFRAVCGGSRARAWALTEDPFAEDPLCAYVPRRRLRPVIAS